MLRMPASMPLWTKFRFNVNVQYRIETSPTAFTNYEDEEESIKFFTVKAPPGTSDTSVPGTLEWTKTVGSQVKVGDIVCTIRFKDGRSLEVSTPVEGYIAVRMKNENEAVQHGDELFKVRLEIKGVKHVVKKKKHKKKVPLDIDEEELPDLSEVSRAKKVENKPTETMKSNAESSSKNVPQETSQFYQPPTWHPGGNQGLIQSQVAYPIPPVMTAMDEINMESTFKFIDHYDRRYFMNSPNIKSLYVKAAAFVLKMKPELNITINNKEAVKKKDIDITVGIRHSKIMAFHTLKNVDKLSYFDIGRVLEDVSRQISKGTYKQGKNTVDFIIGLEWEIGSIFGTPYYSRTCTLGIHKTVQRPVAVGNKIIASPMMYVSLTFDNAFIHDKDAIDFLKIFKLAIEEPSYILVNTE